MTVTRNAEAAAKSAREFIGKAWVNEVTTGKCAGMKFIQMTLDRDIEKVELTKGQRVQLWPNNKRPDKNDADYRVSVVAAR